MKITKLLMACMLTAFSAQAVESERIYLSGTEATDAVKWDFKLERGRGAGAWKTIDVPSCWELQGFGKYEYLKVSQNRGFYKTTFALPDSSKGQRTLIFFEGVLCQAEVKVNGQSAGPVHQGGFYRFSYDITELVKPTGNVLEVTVQKMCDNIAVDKTHRGDYWNFSGIYRPVYLKTVPKEYIDWFAVHGDMDGHFALDVYPKHTKQVDGIRATVKDLKGNVVGSPIQTSLEAGAEKISLSGQFDDVKLWSDEFPNLYQVDVELLAGDKTVHRESDRFGFRRFENKPGKGFFLNGKRVILKGAARHCFWPETGRTMTEEVDRKDVELIKNVLNMNFVRCVHYAPDERFLDLCDEIGLLASSELTGWHTRMPTEPGRALVKELVAKDVNHPSVIQWHNGNHSGSNPDLIDEYHLWDPQDRLVIRNESKNYKTVPDVERFKEKAIDTRYYPDFTSFSERLAPGKVNTVIPNEVLHALYDGGGGAALSDYYRAIRASGAGGGVTIWALIDEAVSRSDKKGKLDGNGNAALDGIIGPYRELEGSAYTCREIFSPIQFQEGEFTADFDGTLAVTNEYVMTTLDQVQFEWELLTYPGPLDAAAKAIVLAKGSVKGPNVAPGATGLLKLDLPAEQEKAHVLHVRAVNKAGTEVISKTWPLMTRSELIKYAFKGDSKSSVSGKGYQLTSGDAQFNFNPKSGQLKTITLGGKMMTFKNGPQLVWSISTGEEVENSASGVDVVALKALGQKVNEPVKDEFDSPWTVQSLDMSDWIANCSSKKGQHIVESKDPAGKGFFRWTICANSTLKLDYSYDLPKGLYGYAGIGFDLADKSVKSKRWLGAGPTRVWKNRLHGPELGLWENNYNDGIPGLVWDLPAFKGNFKDVCWATFQTPEGKLVAGLADTDLYLGVLKPKNGSKPKRALWSYPADGGLFVFNAISPVGAKWRDSREAGPSSASNVIDKPISGTVFIRVAK